MPVGCLVLPLGLVGCSLFERDKPAPKSRLTSAATPAKPAGARSAPKESATSRSAGLSPDQAEPTQPVDVLTINDDTITVDQILGGLRPDLERRAENMSPALYRQYLLDTLRNRIRSKARDVLLFQEASRRLSEQENKFLDKFTDQRLRNLIQEQYQGRQVRWQQAMAQQGLSPDQARERIRRELLIVRYLQQTLSPKISEPTRRDLMRYYQQRKDEMTTPERRELYLIEVPLGDDPSAARARAQEALKLIGQGADFETVAEEYSRGIHASEGGHWGMIEPTSLQGRWAVVGPVLAALDSHTVSAVLDGPESLFIVRAGLIEPAQAPDFSQVQIELNKAYRDRQFTMLVDELVVKLQDQAIIHPENLNLFLMAVAKACPKPTGKRSSR
ncbi:MAG: peptidylprolyl isomerase [Phycisphaerae bacterium]